VSYERQLLSDAILAHLRQFPMARLQDISRELRVSPRTIEKTIEAITGKTFRQARKEILIERVTSLFMSQPTRAIKEISFELGYKSPRSFARAVKSLCDFSPEELRSVVATKSRAEKIKTSAAAG
jgi:AraC-like DNA-binding protein